MPVILRNKTNSIEIDIHANLNYTVSKGGFDVIYEDTGITAVPIVHIVLKANSIISQDIKLDWRDTYIQPGDIPFSSAENLRDTLIGWNLQVVNVGSSVLPVGAATELTLELIKANLDSIYTRQADGNQKAKITQNVSIDPNNSSSINLDISNSYTFTGLKSSTLGVNAIQASLFADKNCTIKVQQSPDGNNWDITDIYYYSANGNFGVTVQAISSYVRILVTTNLETTTVFRLQTALCPIADSVPRSLDFNGSFKIGMGIDTYGFQAENTPNGELRTVIPFRLVGKQFDFYGYNGAPDSNFWLTKVDVTGNPGSVSIANSLCSLNSGINAASFAQILSTRRAPYFGGYTNRYSSHTRIATNQPNNTKRWGVVAYSDYTFTVSASTSAVGDVYSNNGQYFTVMQANNGGTTLYCKGSGAPAASGNLIKVLGAAGSTATVAFSTNVNNWVISDGILFQISGSTFSCLTIKNGIPSLITNFNGHLGGNYMPSTDVHEYEIYYNTTSIYFVVDGQILHTLSAATTNYSSTMHFWAYADNVNSGNTSNTILGFRDATIHRLGPEHTAPAVKHITGNAATYLLKTGPGLLHKIVYNNTSGTSLTIYDAIAGLAGTELGIITTAAGALGSWDYELPFYNGLTIVTTGNGLDATIVYE